MPNNFAATLIILLAVIFITGCGGSNTLPNDITKIAATANSTDTPTPSPATATASSSPISPSPTVTATPTRVDSPTPTLTSTASSTPNIENDSNQTKEATPVSSTPSPEAKKPKATSAPVTNAATVDDVEVYETTITLPTYPFKDYLVEQIDPIYNIPVYYFNRTEYEAAQPTPTPVNYAGIVLENPYLRLTFLPELGGRLYSAVIKTTDQEVFYQNPVVKPSRWGGLQPYEANWWLATGGMEWAYPTSEHGYRFGVAWDYTIKQNVSGATITLTDTAPDRVGLEVSVTLPANSAAFTVAPHLVNKGPQAASIQLWTNAALTLGSESMSPNTQFIVPTNVITVHSRGESGWTVPDAHLAVSWPQVDETDLQDYSQWANYLGFFVPNTDAPFVGAYNPVTNLGIVRLVTANTTSGSSKIFAFGPDFPDRSYTNNDSQYFEIWGGANNGFWPEEDILVPVGQTLGWQERWWPLPQLGGLTWATEHVAIYLHQNGDTHTLSALVWQPVKGTLQILAGEETILNETFSAIPNTPLKWNFTVPNKFIRIQMTDDNDTVLLEHMIHLKQQND